MIRLQTVKTRAVLLCVSIMIAAVILCAALFGCSGGENEKEKPHEDGDYTLRYEAEIGGRIVGKDVQYVDSDADGTAVNATAEYGYIFIGWSDGVTSAERIDKNVTSNISVTARFEKAKYTVRYAAGENGRISGLTEQTVEFGGYGEYVEAVPDEGYEFYKWSDDEKTDLRREKRVQSDVSVTAEFRKKQVLLRYSCNSSIGGEIVGDSLQLLEYGETGTAVTAVAKEGCYFVKWSDGIETPERTDVAKGDRDIMAIFESISYSVAYKVYGNYGYIQTKESQFKFEHSSFTINHFGNGITVTVVPKKNDKGEYYKFVGWSDGVKTPERTDTMENITEDVTLEAYFAYEIDYAVNENKGGRIEGNTHQELAPNVVGEPVTAVPDDGYAFCGWSDLSPERTRSDILSDYERQCYPVWEYVAYFEPIEKMFMYNYGEGVAPLEKQITLNRNDIKSAKFAVPSRDGYVFCGWYADSDYCTRITDETGRYMYGYAAFSLETDTLYARWRKADEKYDPHKILLVLVDELDVELYSSRTESNLRAYRKMSALDYMYVKWTRGKLSDLLNEWLDGIVDVEVDVYFTTEVVDYDSAISAGTVSNLIDYNIYADNLKEVVTLTYKYHNTITFSDFGDNNNKLHGGAGVATEKHAYVNLMDVWGILRPGYGRQLQKDLYSILNGETDLNLTMIPACLHELIHTIERAVCSYPNDDMLHEAIDYAYKTYKDSNISNTKEPLIKGEFEMNGETVGIPKQYWQHQTTVTVNYVPLPVDYQTAGKVIPISENCKLFEHHDYVVGKMEYCSHVCVEAVPNDGYRFVMWTDGVTTAIRNDVNIIARLDVYAIFEKIT